MIPKIIHHTWIGHKPFKPQFKKFRESWMALHPTWTMIFWRWDNLPSMPPEIESIVRDKRYLVQLRADILRLYVLDLYGGIYTDADMECLKPFDDFLDLDFFAGREDSRYICNALIGSKKDNPTIKTLLERSLKNLQNQDISYANKVVNELTGPVLFSEVIPELNLDPAKNKILDPVYFYPIYCTEREKLHTETPNSYAKHYWAGLDPDGWYINK